jgi:hypothetical protein
MQRCRILLSPAFRDSKSGVEKKESWAENVQHPPYKHLPILQLDVLKVEPWVRSTRRTSRNRAIALGCHRLKFALHPATWEVTSQKLRYHISLLGLPIERRAAKSIFRDLKNQASGIE